MSLINLEYYVNHLGLAKTCRLQASIFVQTDQNMMHHSRICDPRSYHTCHVK